MKLKFKLVNDCGILIDESAEIKGGDYFWANEGIRKCIRVDETLRCPYITLQNGKEIGHFHTWRGIILFADPELNLDLPILPDWKKWEIEKFALNNRVFYAHGGDYDTFELGFIEGHNHNKAKYTDEELLGFVEFFIKSNINSISDSMKMYIKSLQKYPKYIVIGTEKKFEGFIDPYYATPKYSIKEIIY